MLQYKLGIFKSTLIRKMALTSINTPSQIITLQRWHYVISSPLNISHADMYSGYFNSGGRLAVRVEFLLYQATYITVVVKCRSWPNF